VTASPSNEVLHLARKSTIGVREMRIFTWFCASHKSGCERKNLSFKYWHQKCL